MICDVFIELALTLAGGHGGNGSMADGESNNATVSSSIYSFYVNYSMTHCLLYFVTL